MTRRTGGEVIPLEAAREPVGDPHRFEPPVPELATLPGLLRVAYRRKWEIVAVALLVLLAAGGWLWREPRIYRATCSIELNPSAPRYLGSGVQDVAESAPSAYWQSKEFFETQYQIIRSRIVAERVVEKLGLAGDAAFLGLDREADPEKRAALLAKADPALRLQKSLRVDPLKDSRIVQISVEDRDPQRARRISEAVAEAYIEQNLERRVDTTRAASEWLADQLGGLKDTLERSELRLHDFKRENDVLTASFEDRQSISSQRLLALNDALTKTRIRLAELEARMRTLQDARRRFAAGEADALEGLVSVAQSAMVGSLKLRLLQLLEEQAEVSGRYLERHPRRIAVEERLGEVRTALQREVEKLVRIAEAEHRETADTERQLRALIDGAKREAFELNRREVDYNRLKREQENNQRLYDLVLQRLKEADLSALLRTNNVQILDRPLLPSRPVRPNPRMVFLAALVLGLLGGFGLAFLRERLDDTVKNQDDVERYLGLPFLGVVPSIAPGEEKPAPGAAPVPRDLFVHAHPKSAVAECVRSVRTNLLLSSPDHPPRRLLVTSAAPQEGKTTVAISLSIAMAQAGSRTLLVDTDMRRPRVHRALGMANDLGLSSVIAGAARLEEAVRETEVPNLWVLPCGPVPPNPAELVHSARFRQLLSDLDGRFDRVVFDSPPVAAVTDALVLAGETDGVVLVVRGRVTRREMARRVRRSLADVNARFFGVVVNDLDLAKGSYGYYYYYNAYRYGHDERRAEG